MSGWQSDAARARRIAAGEYVPPMPCGIGFYRCEKDTCERCNPPVSTARKVALWAAVLLLCLGILLLAAFRSEPHSEPLNGSTDGRYHSCGFVTEQGVTEHLSDYAERCGDLTYASDTEEGR